MSGEQSNLDVNSFFLRPKKIRYTFVRSPEQVVEYRTYSEFKRLDRYQEPTYVFMYPGLVLYAFSREGQTPPVGMLYHSRAISSTTGWGGVTLLRRHMCT